MHQTFYTYNLVKVKIISKLLQHMWNINKSHWAEINHFSSKRYCKSMKQKMFF